MLYPNFSRRTLALILPCLVITLGGVGLFFLLHIFNETSSLLSGPLEKMSHTYQPYEQNVMKNDNFDKRNQLQNMQEFKERSSFHNSNNTYFLKRSDNHIILSSSTRVENISKMLPLNLSTKETKTSAVNQETIYIDDFDRPTYTHEGTDEIGIPIDNNPDVLLTGKNAISKSGKGKANFLDADSTGSGSGDTIDDTESNEINGRKTYYYNNISKFLQRKVTRKPLGLKQRYRLFENHNKSSSFLKRLAKNSHTGNNYVNGMVIKKDSENVFSLTFPKEAGEKVAHPYSFSRYDLFYNDPNLSTFQYNNDLHDYMRTAERSSTVYDQVVNISVGKLKDNDIGENDKSWIETRTKRIIGNVKKSEERSRQLLLCEEAGGGELCRMLFKEHVNNVNN